MSGVLWLMQIRKKRSMVK